MLSLSLLAAPLMACGDDDPVNPDAPKTPDGRIDASIDAPPDMRAPVTFDSDEGGEVRVEYLRFTSGTGTGTRVTGFLWKDAGTTDYHPYINLNGCNNTALVGGDREKWPFKLEADRQYADAGSIVISNPAATSPSFVVNRSGGGCPTTALCDLTDPNMAVAPVRDPFGRVHQQNKWFFKSPGTGAAPANDGALLPPKTKLDVTFTGSADIPAQTFEDVIYIPADFTVNDQAGTLDPAPYAAFDLTLDTAVNVTFENSDDMEPTGYRMDSLVAFTGPNGPAVVCIEPKDGSVTVPANMVNVARNAYSGAAPSGTLARQTLTHVVRELQDNNGWTGRRIDFVSVWCYATAFNTVPVP
jgi:hypothetical protein